MLKENGNLEMFCGRVLIWTSNTFDSRITGLFFKSYRGITLEGTFYRKRILSSSGSLQTYLLVLENSGNLVLYSHSKDWTNLNGLQAALGTDGKCSNSKNFLLLVVVIIIATIGTILRCSKEYLFWKKFTKFTGKLILKKLSEHIFLQSTSIVLTLTIFYSITSAKAKLFLKWKCPRRWLLNKQSMQIQRVCWRVLWHLETYLRL